MQSSFFEGETSLHIVPLFMARCFDDVWKEEPQMLKCVMSGTSQPATRIFGGNAVRPDSGPPALRRKDRCAVCGAGGLTVVPPHGSVSCWAPHVGRKVETAVMAGSILEEYETHNCLHLGNDGLYLSS